MLNAMESNKSEELTNYKFRTLTDLPYEVLEQILSYSVISYVDICRLAQVSRKFVCISNVNELWRRKFLQTWSPLYKLYKERNVDWKQELCERQKYEKIVTDSISSMRQSISLSNRAQNFVLGEFRKHFDGHNFALYFFIDAIERRIHDGNSNINLTNKYYGCKLLQFVRQEHLLRLLQQHVKEADFTKVEIGAYLIAHYCQPTLWLSQEAISNQLDEISVKVKAKLRESCPQHPVLRRDLIPPGNALNETLWPKSEGLMIVHAINAVLFEDLKFKCMSLCDLSTDHIFINQVLETKVGTPIVLSIIFATVSHRLGVRCVHIGGDFGYLKCIEYPELNDTQSFVCVDVSKKGAINTVEVDTDRYETFSSRLLESDPLKPVQSMVDHIADYATVLRRVESQQLVGFYESCALELYSYLAPNSAFRKMGYIEDLLARDSKLFDVLDLLEQCKRCEDASQHLYTYERLHNRAKTYIDEILKEHMVKELTQKKLPRKKYNIAYAVGMIMMNKTSNKICVIDGWEIRKNRARPVYHVLTDDGKQGYVPEEYLIIYQMPKPVQHPEVGKFFEEFNGMHYVPNEARAAEYTEDSAAAGAILDAYFAQSKKASAS